MHKKCDARGKLLFSVLNLFFSTFSLPSASLDVKVPFTLSQRTSAILGGYTNMDPTRFATTVAVHIRI